MLTWNEQETIHTAGPEMHTVATRGTMAKTAAGPLSLRNPPSNEVLQATIRKST